MAWHVKDNVATGVEPLSLIEEALKRDVPIAWIRSDGMAFVRWNGRYLDICHTDAIETEVKASLSLREKRGKSLEAL
ncbi:hypothetical protein DB346_14305 [Verrucomicrobia bacterium LW23]|nr:hypothetical protein DB346_14305 [Verrucomicrobia bacterium LW23]